jgi:hypothetical protein
VSWHWSACREFCSDSDDVGNCVAGSETAILSVSVLPAGVAQPCCSNPPFRAAIAWCGIKLVDLVTSHAAFYLLNLS